MIIKSLHIKSFGGLTDRVIDLSDGVNVICGMNESGKSSAAMFIKFIFYGLSSKSGKYSRISERKKYVNKNSGEASGYIMADTDEGIPYRIERSLSVSDSAGIHEQMRIVCASTGEVVTGMNPGEYFFKVPEEVFVNSCFVSQQSAVRPEIGGVGGAIQNILTSADENTNVKKALKNLDAARRELCHKNGEGGEISKLKEKRDALAQSAKEAEEKNSEIIRITTSLDDIKKRISELEDDKEHYTAVFSALDKILVKRRIDAVTQTRARIQKIERSISDLDASPLGNSFSDELNVAEQCVKNYDDQCAAYDEAVQKIKNSPKDHDDAQGDAELVHSLDNSQRTSFSVAVAMFIAGAVGLAASLMLYYFNTDAYLVPMIMTLTLVTLGVVFIIRHAKLRSELTKLLVKWDAESPDDIETAIDEKNEYIERERMSVSELRSISAAVEAAKIKFDAAAETVAKLAVASNIKDTGDIYETIDKLYAVQNAVERERSSMISKLENYTGRLDLLEEQLEDTDREQVAREVAALAETKAGREALSLDSTGIKETAKKRDFVNVELRTAMKRKSDLEAMLAEIGKPSCDPAETVTKVDGMNRLIDELSIRHDAYQLAGNILEEAGDAMRSGIIPRISAKASAIMKSSSPHDGITLDNDFNTGYTDGDEVMSCEFLSKGTEDLSYIALRIALTDELFSAEKPIMVFDESFAHIDKERLGLIFGELINSQYLILTCREDEAALSSDIRANIINL